MASEGGGTRVVQLIDLTEPRSMQDGKLIRNEKEIPRGEMCYFASPYDAPWYVRFYRRLVKREDTAKRQLSYEHLGTTMEVDLYTFGVKLYVRHDRAKVKGGNDSLKIILEDGDGRTVVATYDHVEADHG